MKSAEYLELLELVMLSKQQRLYVYLPHIWVVFVIEYDLHLLQ